LTKVIPESRRATTQLFPSGATRLPSWAPAALALAFIGVACGSVGGETRPTPVADQRDPVSESTSDTSHANPNINAALEVPWMLDALDALRAADCRRSISCGEYVSEYHRFEACHPEAPNWRVARTLVLLAAERGTVVLDGAALDECTRDSACLTSVGEQPSACAVVFRGVAAHGAACLADFECTQPGRCVLSTGGFGECESGTAWACAAEDDCPPGFYCTGDRICARRSGVDGPCTSPFGCLVGLTCSIGTCVASRGRTCTDACPGVAVCADGYCDLPDAPTHRCTSEDDCILGFACAGGRCAPSVLPPPPGGRELMSPGSSCSIARPCAPGLRCAWSTAVSDVPQRRCVFLPPLPTTVGAVHKAL
jgi:hypothetical protein